jgi:hypothetical protein
VTRLPLAILVLYARIRNRISRKLGHILDQPGPALVLEFAEPGRNGLTASATRWTICPLLTLHDIVVMQRPGMGGCRPLARRGDLDEADASCGDRALAVAAAAAGSAASAVPGVQSVADGVIIHPANGGTERIQVCGDRILRVSYVAQGDLPATQSLVVNAAWPAHPHFVVRPDGADGVVVATADV